MTRHQCAASETGEGSSCRQVFGDLVPIEQYANGGDGRHHRSGNPFASEISVNRLQRRMDYEAATTTKES